MLGPQPYPLFKAFDDNGVPLNGGKVYTYEVGTTTARTTYSDRARTTPNANPVVLDSNGEAVIYLAAGVTKFVLKDSDDVTLWTQDYVGDTVTDEYRASDYGTLGSYAALSAAVTAIGSTACTLYLAPATWTVSSDLTIPANINLKPDKGAVLTVATTKTLTINGSVEAGRWQIFDWAGTGTIAGSPLITETYPEWFGATGDGSTDDYADVQKCITVATTWRKPVSFRPGATYKLNTKLTKIDVSLTQLRGENTTLDFTGLSADGTDAYAIQLYSTATYYTRELNRVKALFGLRIAGYLGSSPAEKNHTGLCVGDATETNNALFTLENCSIQGFKYNLRLIDNCWHVAFRDCDFIWGGFYVGTSLTNFGSKMVFDNCQFIDTVATGMTIGDGNYIFNNCTWDNHLIEINGEVEALWQGCYFERANSTATTGIWLNVNHQGALAILNGCFVFWGDPGGTYTSHLFNVHDSNREDVGATDHSRGLVIRDLFISQGNVATWYAPTAHRTLVGGTGRCVARGIHTYLGGAPGIQFAIAQYPNAIYNGGQEDADLTGWTASGTGTTTRDASVKKNGSYSMKTVCTAGQSKSIYQEFDCRPGDKVSISMWVNNALSAGTMTANGTLAFYTLGGDALTGDSYTTTAATGGWVNYYLNCPVPSGAVKGRITFDYSATGGTQTSYVDDVIVSVY